jgi:predicted ATPase
MHIAAFQVDNYKSFSSSREMNFRSGFNVIVGQNNVGKTALVETLSLQFGNNPHRSLETFPTRSATPDPSSRVNISFEFGEQEFVEALSEMSVFYVPVEGGADVEDEKKRFLDAIREENIINCTFTPNEGVSGARLLAYGATEHGHMREFTLDRTGKDSLQLGLNTGLHPYNQSRQFATHLGNIARSRIYSFRAVRFDIRPQLVASNPNLEPDASNLAQVLNNLQTSNPSRFQQFNELVRTIFPQVKQITAPPVADTNSVHILVWNIDPVSERDDLAVPLSESGTGIGQVLAILYVVLTSEYPRPIIIDEPQSFLHPGAVRKLFDILKQYPQHQYIITTHSPTAVTAADPQTLVLVRKEEAESTIETVDVGETQQLRLFLSEIGARLSDVFGADNILWVEGRTEELCFPSILSRIANRPLLGTAIIGVVQTGDFESKYSNTVLEIYERLSQGRGLLPPALGFVFDREGRSKTEQEDLVRRSNGKVHFTPRRMYENHLLSPQAIASRISRLDDFRDDSVTSEEVDEWLERNRWNRKYFESEIDESERSKEVWLDSVHGARVLHDVFQEFSEGRGVYDKVEDGVALTEWFIDNAAGELMDLVELLQNVLTNRAMP